MALAFGPGDTLYTLNLFGYAGSHRCVTGSTNVTVTAYAPGASGDVEPARYIVVVTNGKSFTSDRQYGWYLPNGVSADTSNAVQVWHTAGAVLYGAGASGFVPPSRSLLESREEGTDAGGVAVSSNGKIYRTAAPTVRPMIC
jgi:hypothetical protein